LEQNNPADTNNLIDIAARCLLVKMVTNDFDRHRNGNKQSENFYGTIPLGTHSLDNSLAKYGFHRDDITDVFMTHLHFDHCGGSIQWNKDKTGYEPAFKILTFGQPKPLEMGNKTKR
jgi:glyoxylase-like metal-dependent hydrolase (beta-lactamase superfamily II)